MASIYEFNAQEYNLKLAEALKKVAEFEMPEWAGFVKSGSAKERPIDDEDFLAQEGCKYFKTNLQKRDCWGKSFKDKIWF